MERRTAILAVARESFFDNGYAATSMSEIASKLGGSKGTLWSYFPSKEELFAAVLDEATAAFRQQLSEVLHLHTDLRTTLTQLCTHFVRKVTEPMSICLHRLINGEGARFPEIGQIFYERGPKNVKAMVAAYLDQCIEAGTIRKVDTLRAATNLVSLCTAGTHQKMLLNVIDTASEEDIRADAANAVDIFMRAYATGKDGASAD